jgi:hypothetical protein
LIAGRNRLQRVAAGAKVLELDATARVGGAAAKNVAGRERYGRPGNRRSVGGRDGDFNVDVAIVIVFVVVVFIVRRGGPGRKKEDNDDGEGGA